jgi:hypothetical protein
MQRRLIPPRFDSAAENATRPISAELGDVSRLLLVKFDQQATHADCIYGTNVEKCGLIRPGGVILTERLYYSVRAEQS